MTQQNLFGTELFKELYVYLWPYLALLGSQYTPEVAKFVQIYFTACLCGFHRALKCQLFFVIRAS